VIINKINLQLREVWQSPQVRGRMDGLGLDAVTNSPAEFSKYIQSEIQRWRTVIANAGVRLQ
jgi:tripartite-type tricarboxylate transporter receptor subunit TctC